MGSLENILGGGLWSKIVMAGLTVLVVIIIMRVLGIGTTAAGEVMSAADAHAKASRGEITLVDIRRPDEWKQTGVATTAHTITMHQPGPQLLKQLDAVLGGDRSKPLAIICRTGNRTSSLLPALEKEGFTRVFNVAEGMAGSRYGSGWARSGLPVRNWTSGDKGPVLTEAR